MGRGGIGANRWTRSCVVSMLLHGGIVMGVLVGGLPRYEADLSHREQDLSPAVLVELVTPKTETAATQPGPPLPVPSRGVTHGRSSRVSAVRRPPLPVFHLRFAANVALAAAPGVSEDAPQPPGPEAAPSASALRASAGREFKVAVGAVPTVSASVANYLRTDERFPRLPESLRQRGVSYRVWVEICVSSSGLVDKVIVKHAGPPALDQTLVRAIQSWRYRPWIHDGNPSPFCHPMRFEYSWR